jgi:photosystem II stability/assembly factor-like uncharacterized protein
MVVSARVGTRPGPYRDFTIALFNQSVTAAPPPVPLAIAFRDPAHGVLGTSRTIELTSDGGRTWRIVLRTPRPVVSVSVLSGSDYARYDDGENLVSRNGGRTWAPTVVSDLFNAVCPQGTERSFVSLDWALCGSEPGAGEQAKYVYRDVPNRGWKRLAAHGLEQSGYAEGIAMAADGFGVIWENRGTLYVTRDGGVHWTGLPKISRPEVDFDGSATALAHGVADVLLERGGATRLIATRDAGRTWRVIHRWR